MKDITVICDCGGTIIVKDESWLGAEVECGNCYSDFYIPETPELVEAHNTMVLEAHEQARHTGKYRVMMLDECGHERCLYNDVPEDLRDVVVAGVIAQYPEASAVFYEEEENRQYQMTQLALRDF